MKHTIISALQLGWPGCSWALLDCNDFSTLTWYSEQVAKPSLEDVHAKIEELDRAEATRLLRQRRDDLLAQSDVKALPDFPHASDDVRAAWLAYRQALRNLTVDANPSLDPVTHELADGSVAWPVPP